MSKDLDFDTSDLKKFEKTMKVMGGVPQKAATKAASKGLTVVRRTVKKGIPTGPTGELKKGLYRKGEKHRLSGKKVYQLTFDPKKNDIFQKPIKNPGIYGGKHLSHGYYPNSVEYGFLTKKKGGGREEHVFSRLSDKQYDSIRRHRKRVKVIVSGYESKKVEGLHYMKKGAEAAAPSASNTIADTLIKEATKVWEQN